MYSFTGRVRYSECDEDARLSLVAMMNYLQDASTFQTESLGMGVDGLRDRGMAWVLLGWEIEVDELPRFAERIEVSTWDYELTRTHALRCFEIRDGQGRSLARADSRWAVFDTEKNRATRVPEDQGVYLEDTPRLPMPPMERRISCPQDAVTCPEITVSEQNLDTNHHVNNAQYVLFAQSALAGLGHTGRISRLAVQYKTMAWLGDTVVPHAGRTEGGWVVSLASPEGAVYANVRLALS